MATYQNQASLTYSGGAVLSNIVTGEIVEVLSVTKTAVNQTYGVGGDNAYVITILNTGTTPFTGLTVSDDLGGYAIAGGTTVYPLTYNDGSVLYYVNGVLQPAPTVTAGPPLTVTGISVPAGGNATIIYEASTAEYASPETNGTINNTATVLGDTLTTPVTAVARTGAATAADLAIVKSAAPAAVSENGTLTFTFTVQNFGNTEATAADLVAINDTLTPALNNITVTYNGTEWAAPTNYTYTNGVFQTVPGQITVPPATYTQDAATGAWATTPGTATLVVSGTV